MCDGVEMTLREGEAGSPVSVVSLPARGRPPQAAAGRAGLGFVEKLLTTKLTSTVFWLG
jgi:hypothetical protein